MVLPAYEDYCFTNVPGIVGEAFGVDIGRSLPTGTVDTTGVDNVVLVLVDGLGLRRFRRDGPGVSFLRRVGDAGQMTPLTSTFPSETSAAIATVHTGRTPAEHGLIGGNLFLPESGFVLESLSFARRGGPPGSAGDSGEGGLDPSVLNSSSTVYERLAAAGVESHVVQPTTTLGTPYAEAMLTGSTRHGYDDATAAGHSIRTHLERAMEPTYIYCYLPHVDALSHRHGPDADAYRTGLATACAGIEQELDALAAGITDPERTLVLVVADHGHVPASPETITDLTADPVIRESFSCLQGTPIRPTGSPRSAFLHLRADRIDRVRDRLHERFDGHIFDRETALNERALFGPDPNDRTRRRCGDLVYVPHKGGAWFGESVTEKRSLHGGLDAREMLVPCVAARLSDI